MGKIRAIVKRADEQYGHVTWISNTLENLQRTVGGYVEAITCCGPRMDSKPYVVLCDEEGRLKGKPHNCSVYRSPRKPNGFAEDVIDFVGDIAVVGIEGEDFSDCPLDFKDWKRMVLL